MAGSALARDASLGGSRAPSASLLWAIGLFGCAAAASTVALAFAIEHLPDPVALALIADWIVVPYIGAGLVALWRRPESRFGPF